MVHGKEESQLTTASESYIRVKDYVHFNSLILVTIAFKVVDVLEYFII